MVNLLGSGVTVKFKVTTESHPLKEVNVSSKAPELFRAMPFQRKDWLAQMVLLILLGLATIKRFKVTTESQPLKETKVSLKAPEVFLS